MESFRSWFYGSFSAHAAEPPRAFSGEDGDDDIIDKKAESGRPKAEEFAEEKPMRQGEVEEGSGNDRSGVGARATSTSGDEEEEDEELKNETCGFCKFMKKGPCRQSFTAWSKCVDEAKENNEDFVDKCMEQTQALRDCMEANPSYYSPVMFDEDEGGEEEAELGSPAAAAAAVAPAAEVKGGPTAGAPAAENMKKSVAK